MARTNLPLTTMTPNGAVLNNAGTAIDAANGMTIALPSNAIPASPDAEQLLLYVQNTFAGTKTVIVRAGTSNPPAFRGGLGDLTSGNLTASTGTAFIGPFDSARFVQSDGSVSVDFAASMTGTIWAVIVPARF